MTDLITELKDVATEFQKNSSAKQELFKEMMPKVTFTKTGYELRTQILDIAAKMVKFDYDAKIGQINIQNQYDERSGTSVQTVEFPDVPGVTQVLDAAKQLYEFVNQNTSKRN